MKLPYFAYLAFVGALSFLIFFIVDRYSGVPVAIATSLLRKRYATQTAAKHPSSICSSICQSPMDFESRLRQLVVSIPCQGV